MPSRQIPELTGSLYSDLLRYATRRLGSTADAADVVQHVLLHALTSPSPQGPGLRPYLFRAARNRIVDLYRSRSRSARVTLQSDAEGAATSTHGADEPDAQAAAIAAYAVRLIDSLPPGDQDVLMRIDLTGGTTIEYASQEGLSYDGAKSRVTRARRRLKQALLRDCEITLDARGKPIECRPKATDCCAPASGD